jgi:hypothetical protein
MPFNGRLLREHYPGSVHLRKSSLGEAVKAVCVGEAQAAFADHIAVFSLLLSNPPCPGTSLRIIPTPTIKIKLGLGATKESRVAADAIREEIGVMADDGSLAEITNVWSHTAGQELASLVVLQDAKRRLRWYRIGFVTVGGLLVFALWTAAAYRQQRNRAQAYYRALAAAQNGMYGSWPTV